MEEPLGKKCELLGAQQAINQLMGWCGKVGKEVLGATQGQDTVLEVAWIFLSEWLFCFQLQFIFT